MPPLSNAASMILSLVQKPVAQREADDRQVPADEDAVGDRHDLRQAAEAAHVDAVVHGVHDRAGREEQRGLEEAVAEQVDDADRVHARARVRRPGTCSRSG